MKKLISTIMMMVSAVSLWSAEPVDSVAMNDSTYRYELRIYAPGDFKFGFYAGVGGLFNTGNIGDGFSGAFTFNAGVQAGYRRLALEGAFLYGSPSIETPNITAAVDANGVAYHNNVNSANLFGAGINLGYAVMDNQWVSITPWVGGMWTSYRWTACPMAENDEGILVTKGNQQDFSVDDFNIAFGVNFEWHFSRSQTDVVLFGSDGQEYRSSLRITPYMIKGAYSGAHPELDGWHIGVSLAYTGVIRALGLEY